jgi:uncharacterized protein (DUF1501 family)
MTFQSLKSRRDFLRFGARTISAVGAAAAFGQAGLLTAATAPADDYKALVCVFLFGGNDSNNMLVPTDTPTYNTYKAVRGSLALNQAALAPLAGTNFGLHPSMTALEKLFQKDSATGTTRLAVLANVGTLVKTVPHDSNNKPNLNAVPLPSNLFSHSDQQTEWQNANPAAASGIIGGWSGRLADIVAVNQSFPASIGVSGGALQLIGEKTQPTTVGTSNFTLLTGLSDPRTSALQTMQQISLSSGVTLVQAVGQSLKSALDVANTVDNAVKSATTTLNAFPNTDVGTQLQQVAQIIQIRKALGVTRQIFFVTQGGFDTHSDQLPQHQTLMGNLAAALAAFDTAVGTLGELSNVTTFTQSDFSRTFQPNGNAGTDHAWGSHHLILGGAVQGGKIYGTFPQLVLTGPDDSGNRGNWVPTTSTDQYGAELAKWFGVTAQSDLDYVFPNLKSFNYTGPGFLGV